MLSDSEELKSQANQAALKDSKVFNGFNRQPAETACRDSLQRQPAEVSMGDMIPKDFK